MLLQVRIGDTDMKIAENVTKLVGNTPNMLEEKLEHLKGILRSLESVIIAYSGGICRATEAAV